MKPFSADLLIHHVDAALRTLHGVTHANRTSPAEGLPDPELTDTEKLLSGRLMRVNHCGEICAQALYLGQGLTSRNESTAETMSTAAEEESDHLAWCEQRLSELDTHPSYLNPIFYGLSFAGGAVSGLLGDRFNLGFVAATEEQVVTHLENHIEKLPKNDRRSMEILEQMKIDEEKHRTSALNHGGEELARPLKKVMTALSKVMTKSTYWI